MSTQFQSDARNIMVTLERAGGAHEITYKRKSGETVTTIGIKDISVDEFGNFESTVSEWREAWDLLREDIGEPCRGDKIIDENSKNWTVQDVLETSSDSEIVRVTVT